VGARKIRCSRASAQTHLGHDHDRGSGYLDVIARLNAGLNIEQAQADLNTVANRLAQQYPDSNKGRGVKLIFLREQ